MSWGEDSYLPRLWLVGHQAVNPSPMTFLKGGLLGGGFVSVCVHLYHDYEKNGTPVIKTNTEDTREEKGAHSKLMKIKMNKKVPIIPHLSKA